MQQLQLTLSPDESLDVLRELVGCDITIEDIERKLDNAKLEVKALKADLEAAVDHRAEISRQARDGAVERDDDDSDE